MKKLLDWRNYFCYSRWNGKVKLNHWTCICNYGFKITADDGSTDLHVQMPHYISKSNNKLKMKVLLGILSPAFKTGILNTFHHHLIRTQLVARCCIFLQVSASLKRTHLSGMHQQRYDPSLLKQGLRYPSCYRIRFVLPLSVTTIVVASTSCGHGQTLISSSADLGDFLLDIMLLKFSDLHSRISIWNSEQQ